MHKNYIHLCQQHKDDKRMTLFRIALFIGLMNVSALVTPVLARDTQTMQSERDSVEHRSYGTFALKTNLLEWASATINLGGEVTLSPHYSLELTGSVNPFRSSSEKKWRHYQATGELRYWTKESMRGHFFGIHAGGGRYNVGGIKVPFWGFKKDYRYEGWHIRAGLTYGYRWVLGRHWDLEGLVGLGVVHTKYDKYNCNGCFESSKNKTFFAPTRLALNLVYTFGRDRKRNLEPIYVEVPVVRTDTIYIENTKIVPLMPTLEEKYPFVHRVGDKASDRRHLPVRYRLDDMTLYTDYSENAKNLATILEAIDAVYSSENITLSKVDIVGYASPEGPHDRNVDLGNGRAENLKKYLLEKDPRLEESKIAITSGAEDWEGLRELVVKSDMVGKDDVLRVIDTMPAEDRKVALRKLNGGRVYNSIFDVLYPQLRSACYIDVWYEDVKK